MRTLKLLCCCIITQLLACSPVTQDVSVTEKQHLEEDVTIMETSLIRQQAIMDSITAVEEMEIAQQIIIEQQLTELKAKIAGEETGSQADLVSFFKKEDETQK